MSTKNKKVSKKLAGGGDADTVQMKKPEKLKEKVHSDTSGSR